MITMFSRFKSPQNTSIERFSFSNFYFENMLLPLQLTFQLMIFQKNHLRSIYDAKLGALAKPLLFIFKYLIYCQVDFDRKREFVAARALNIKRNLR